MNKNIDINQILSTLSKMDKKELEKNIQIAQQILDNSNIKNNQEKK